MKVDVLAATNLVNMTERAVAPYRTGNLAFNGIGNVEQLTPNEAHYSINKGGASGAAPYGVLLNEAMLIRGNSNVHYHWHDKAFVLGLRIMAEEIGGELL